MASKGLGTRRTIAPERRRCALALWLVVIGEASLREFSPPVDRGEARRRSASFRPERRSNERSQRERLAQRLLDDPAIAHVVVYDRSRLSTAVTTCSPRTSPRSLRCSPTDALPATPRRRDQSDAVARARRTNRRRRPRHGRHRADQLRHVRRAKYRRDGAARIAQRCESDPNATDVRVSDAGVSTADSNRRRSAKRRCSASLPTTQPRRRASRPAARSPQSAHALGSRQRASLQSDATRRGDLDAAMRVRVRDPPTAGWCRSATSSTCGAPSSRRSSSAKTANASSPLPQIRSRSACRLGSITAPLARLLRDPSFLPPGAAVAPRGDVEQFLETLLKILTTLCACRTIVYVDSRGALSQLRAAVRDYG